MLEGNRPEERREPDPYAVLETGLTPHDLAEIIRNAYPANTEYDERIQQILDDNDTPDNDRLVLLDATEYFAYKFVSMDQRITREDIARMLHPVQAWLETRPREQAHVVYAGLGALALDALFVSTEHAVNGSVDGSAHSLPVLLGVGGAALIAFSKPLGKGLSPVLNALKTAAKNIYRNTVLKRGS